MRCRVAAKRDTSLHRVVSREKRADQVGRSVQDCSAAGDCTNGCPARRCGRQRRDRREVYSAVLQDRRTAGRCLRRPLAVDAGGVTEEGADVFPDPAVRTVITTRAAPSHKGAVGQTAMHMPDRDHAPKGEILGFSSQRAKRRPTHSSQLPTPLFQAGTTSLPPAPLNTTVHPCHACRRCDAGGIQRGVQAG